MNPDWPFLKRVMKVREREMRAAKRKRELSKMADGQATEKERERARAALRRRGLGWVLDG